MKERRLLMQRGFLLKTLAPVIALAAVLAIVVTTMRGDFGAAAGRGVQSQTFLEQFVVAGGPIVWFVLLPMSLVTVYLAAEYAFTIRRKSLVPDGVGRRIVEIVQDHGPGQLEARLGDSDDFVSSAVVRAVTQGREDWFRVRNLLFESLEEQALGLMRKIEWVNLIGNVSPMVGLFGTVFGMIKLFNAIVSAGGQPQPAQLADGISVALVTTFWGLVIAIPALAVHGVFRNRIEALVSAATAEAENILPEIMVGLKRTGTSAPAAQKQPVARPGIRELAGKSPASLRQASPQSR
ncbi:MAG TPA: MotA/TolQ/ExbB proton channel family protein [Sedimentisphaerales bacterium]|nr:MotA/TolQ/ExbB proton channel family protein [Sedimentisphaerales bacterium]